MSTALEVEDLHVHFHTRSKTVHAVRGVCFSLKQGESLAIVGESGSGKTATAKALMGLLSASSGKVFFNDLDLLSLKEKQMRRYRGKEIGMIFQDPMSSLNPTMKVGKQIMEGYLRHYPKKSRKDAFMRAIELLHLVGIYQPETRMLQYPHELSGGMCQRVMIAIALSASPKILIADEPTTALDVTIQAQILDLLKEIQKKTETSIILITHDLSIVASLCDRVLVMYGGQIVENADVHQLFSSPMHPYTKRLLKVIPRMDAPQEKQLHPIEGSPPDLSVMEKGCPFFPRCSEAMHICREKNPPIIKNTRCWLYNE